MVDLSLSFDADHHVYSIGGRHVPSVTQIIGAVIPRQWNPDSWYMERGTMIHKAAVLMLRKELDESTLDPRISGQVSAAARAVRDLSIDPYFCVLEKPRANSTYGFAGTPDLFLPHGLILDWKSSVEPTAEMQLGAYSILCEEPKARLLACELHEDGTYQLSEYKAPRARNLFLNIFTVYQWMKKNGRLPKGD